MLPNHNVQGKIGPYDRNDVSLPQISAPQKIFHMNDLSGGRGYAYKSPIDQQNSAMITKLLNRKKSYERMMK